ncbi:MAG: hypothetical protein IKR81_05955, partial [Victivallales bacterium]|nr:hypothetical protein [Victivallales bacterium]
MHTYAISLSCLGRTITDEAAEALQNSRLDQAEIQFRNALLEDDDQRKSLENVRRLVRSGALRPASVHLPFAVHGCWLDPSSPDEAMRSSTVALFSRLIRENSDLLGPQMTMHASMEPI